MYLHTKLGNPHYAPEIQAETTLCNFMVTSMGLEDQLLALVVRKERPDLASKKAALIKQSNSFKIKMLELEDEILAKLGSSDGDITEDEELISGLEDAKRIADGIAKKLVAGKATTVAINAISEEYRPVRVFL